MLKPYGLILFKPCTDRTCVPSEEDRRHWFDSWCDSLWARATSPNSWQFQVSTSNFWSPTSTGKLVEGAFQGQGSEQIIKQVFNLRLCFWSPANPQHSADAVHSALGGQKEVWAIISHSAVFAFRHGCCLHKPGDSHPSSFSFFFSYYTPEVNPVLEM